MHVTPFLHYMGLHIWGQTEWIESQCQMSTCQKQHQRQTCEDIIKYKISNILVKAKFGRQCHILSFSIISWLNCGNQCQMPKVKTSMSKFGSLPVSKIYSVKISKSPMYCIKKSTWSNPRGLLSKAKCWYNLY